jgi:hypothetical protein
MAYRPSQPDADEHKGAIEDDHHLTETDETNASLRGQLPHRALDEEVRGMDTDFPEPGENPEHT